MRTNHTLTLAVLAGVSIGVAGATVIHAQQVKTPPGYIIAQVKVTDPDPTALQKYGAQAPGKSKSSRLRLATFGVAHAYVHYGQIVE